MLSPAGHLYVSLQHYLRGKKKEIMSWSPLVISFGSLLHWLLALTLKKYALMQTDFCLDSVSCLSPLTSLESFLIAHPHHFIPGKEPLSALLCKCSSAEIFERVQGKY